MWNIVRWRSNGLDDAVVGSFLGTPWSNKSDAQSPEWDNPRNLLFRSRIHGIQISAVDWETVQAENEIERKKPKLFLYNFFCPQSVRFPQDESRTYLHKLTLKKFQHIYFYLWIWLEWLSRSMSRFSSFPKLMINKSKKVSSIWPFQRRKRSMLSTEIKFEKIECIYGEDFSLDIGGLMAG